MICMPATKDSGVTYRSCFLGFFLGEASMLLLRDGEAADAVKLLVADEPEINIIPQTQICK